MLKRIDAFQERAATLASEFEAIVPEQYRKLFEDLTSDEWGDYVEDEDFWREKMNSLVRRDPVAYGWLEALRASRLLRGALSMLECVLEDRIGRKGMRLDQSVRAGTEADEDDVAFT